MGRSDELLERGDHLAVLAEYFSDIVTGSEGRLVLVGGEAGVGKTVLLQGFCDEHRGSATVFWGACDALLTPGPLGPLFEVADVTGGELEELVTGGARPHEIASALLAELGRRAPVILVLEDVHWADEATLDVIRLLGRRIQQVRALILATYRDDEMHRADPLRMVLGELATGRAVRRLELSPLSAAAVAKLAEPRGLDGEDLYLKTNGNPFFVNEVLATGAEEIPNTVRDAVLARAARLSPQARELIDAAAVVPTQAEVWLLAALAEGVVDRLEECLASGMLIPTPDGVAFRHELARLTIEETLAPDRRLALNRKAVDSLETPPKGTPDHARLANHAEAADDADAVLRFAPAAAERASSLGAHREAAAQYARVLRFGDTLPPNERADLLESKAYECYLTNHLDEAIDAQQSALACRRGLEDTRKEGNALRSLARLLGFAGRTEEAAAAAREAVNLLEQLEPGRELAMAYGKLAQRCMCWEDSDGAVDWGTRALELAERFDDTEIAVYALTTIGAAEFRKGSSEALQKLERSLDLAQAAGLEDHVGRVFLNIVWPCTRQRSFALANRYLKPGLEYCEERGLDYWGLSLLACRARLELDQGRWTEAADSASLVVRDPRTSPLPRVLALVVQGLVRARRGDPEVWPLLDRALALAQPTGELQQIAPAAAARAEAAWLEGRHREAAAATDAALELAHGSSSRWESGELACWLQRAGGQLEIPASAAEPFAFEMNGEYTRAAELWAEIGCPYESALALGHADDEGALRQAHGELQEMGATPAAAIVARRLRERGARGLPRGPRAATKQNPAGLTAREAEVLELVAQGLRNADIAERLFLSEKTVGHHVSAILRKLDVRTRGEAGAEAARLGLTQDR